MPICMKLRHQLPFIINTYQVMSGHNMCSLSKHCASDYPFTSVAWSWLSLTRFSFWWYLLYQVTLLCEKIWWTFIFPLSFLYFIQFSPEHCSSDIDIAVTSVIYPKKLILFWKTVKSSFWSSLSLSPYTSTCMHKNLHPNSLMHFLDTLLRPL